MESASGAGAFENLSLRCNCARASQEEEAIKWVHAVGSKFSVWSRLVAYWEYSLIS